MKWKAKQEKDTSEWHTWFAWYPVRTIGGIRVWWENVLAKQVVVGPMSFANVVWLYKTEEEPCQD